MRAPSGRGMRGTGVRRDGRHRGRAGQRPGDGVSAGGDGHAAPAGLAGRSLKLRAAHHDAALDASGRPHRERATVPDARRRRFQRSERSKREGVVRTV